MNRAELTKTLPFDTRNLRWSDQAPADYEQLEEHLVLHATEWGIKLQAEGAPPFWLRKRDCIIDIETTRPRFRRLSLWVAPSRAA